jgi:hypothetical protein
MEEATAKGKSTPAVTTGKSHKGVAEAGQGSQSAPPPGMGTGTAGLKLDQYGTNLLGASTHFSFPSLLTCGQEVPQMELAGAENGRVGLEGSSISTVTDPLSSWSVDSPDPLGPPAKVARREAGAGISTVAEVVLLGEAVGEEAGAVGQAMVQDLLQEARTATPVVRGPRSAAIPYARKTASKPASAVRKSARHGKGRTAASTTVMEKAQQLAADKNLETAGINNKKADKGTDFAILDILPDSHLSSVVKDSCIVFSPSLGCPGEALSIIRAKEQVQAALAATARRLQLESEARKAAETTSMAPAQERQGALEEQGSDSRVGQPLRDEEAASTASEGEEDDQVNGTHLATAAGPDLDGAKGRTTQAPKRRRKKSSLTVRKNSSKRRGAS